MILKPRNKGGRLIKRGGEIKEKMSGGREVWQQRYEMLAESMMSCISFLARRKGGGLTGVPALLFKLL